MSYTMRRNLIITGVVTGLFLIVFFMCADVENIEGYQVGVVHKWSGGVQDDYLRNGMNWTGFGKIHVVDVGTQKLSFAPQKKNDEEGADTADNEFDAIEVACGNEGGQKATIVLTVVYHLDPTKAVQLYKDGIHKDYQYKIMKRTIVDVVNECVRPKEALEIYSGIGFNELRLEIDKKIKAHEVLTSRGIIIENATLYAIKLDPEYEQEIQLKQLAKQKKLRATEEKLAAVEEALAEEAKQQVMVATRQAEADAKKNEVVTAAEGQAEMQVLEADAKAKARVAAATAEKQELALQGEGQMEKDVFEAKGLLALGEAKAKAADLLKEAMYAGEAGQLRARVELGGLLAEKLKGMLAGINVIPEKAFIALTADGMKVPLALTDVGVGANVASKPPITPNK